MSTNWKDFFDNHAPNYDQNVFTQNTRAEVEFLLDLFKLPPKSNILDIGCGTGRHSLSFAQQGFAVTGVDLSPGMLATAKSKAESLGIPVVDTVPKPGEVRFIESDARVYDPDIEFDAVICLCEGGLGLVSDRQDPISHDLSILKTAYKAVRPNGMFVTTVLNGYAVIRQMTDEQVAEGRFDPASMMAIYDDEWTLPEGTQVVHIRERTFIPPEMVAMLRHVGFEVLNVWGGTAGDWGRRPVKLDEVEAMYVCRKP